MRTSHLFLFILYPVLLARTIADTATQNESPAEDSCPDSEIGVEYNAHADSLVSWIRSQEGMFNSKLEIREVNSDGAAPVHGIFAKEAIETEEIILEVPRHLLIDFGEEAGQNRRFGDLNCGAVYTFAEELRLGSESQYATYIEYLLKMHPRGQIPSAWSDAGKDLLVLLFGEDWNGTQILPPYSPFVWITEKWREDCDGSDDPLEELSVVLLVQRGNLIVPGYDLMRHRNGKWLNTKSNDPHNKESNFKVQASRGIMPGEEVYVSRYLEYCPFSQGTYGTSETFRDQGLVEQYPQRWVFHSHGIAFDIDGDVLTELSESVPIKDNLVFLKEQNMRLLNIKRTALNSRPKDNPVPESEWTAIVEYHKAISFAIYLAIKKIADKEKKCDSFRYSDLDKRLKGFDLDGYMDETCTGEFFPWEVAVRI